MGEHVASGGSSEVLHAEGSPVCAKVVRGGYVATTLCEITLLTALKHPNIIKLLGIEYGDGQICIEMPYFSLGMRHYCHTENTEATIRQLSLGIAGGLAYMHARGVIHCDLKPDNIYVTLGEGDEIQPIIADFGTSMLDCSPRTSHDIQTPLYRAPEMTIGAYPRPAIDIWSFGVILLELTGYRHAFNKDKQLAEYVSDMRAAVTKIPVATDNPISTTIHGCFTTAAARIRAVDIIRAFGGTLPTRPTRHLVGASAANMVDAVETAIYAALPADAAITISPIAPAVSAIRMCITGQVPQMRERDVTAAMDISRAAKGKIFR